MTDPIERVARAYYEATDLGIFEMSWDKLSTGDKDFVVSKVRKFFGVLTEQGIPIDKLLSGEMVALDKEAPVDHAGRDAAGNLHAHIGGHCFTRMVHVDYAGNPPVTPEECQEPTGATHSEKSPITWTWDRD